MALDLNTRQGRPGAASKPAYRPEVQGLRAFAVLMVVVYHVWLGRVSGGVDVFLLISAFLLTASFTHKVESGKPLKLVSYWLQRFRGLLPAAVVVLLAILAATASLLPRTRWHDVFTQTWSSLFYTQNWTLARESVDYYAANHATASPLQHFWSLSIQGQVFILWPLILAACALAWRALRGRFPRLGYRALVGAAFGVVFAVSLAYSVHATATNQAYAYFDTRARLWEFALGSLLVLAVPYAAKLSVRIRVVLGWVGLAAMLSCGLILQVQAQFPGYIALWPTLAAAAIIAAGDTRTPASDGGAPADADRRRGVDRLLAAKPLVALGGISYALYLWHWPILVIFLTVRELHNPGILGGLAVIGLSLALAWATTRVVETPFHAWHWPTQRRRRLSLVLAVMVGIVAMPLSGWESRVAAFETAAKQQAPADNPGAQALAPDFEYDGDPAAVVRPLASDAGAEWANYGGDCTGDYRLTDPRTEFCQIGGDPATAQKTVMVVGDSHAQHWTSALSVAAEKNDWAWVLVTQPGCRFGGPTDERSAECNGFSEAATQYAVDHRPDAVVTLGTLTAFTEGEDTETRGDEERIVPAYEEGIRPFLEAGIDVVALRDTPRYPFNVPECVDRKGADSTECSAPTEEIVAPVSPLEELERRMAPETARPGSGKLGFMDMTDQLCVDGTCRPVIGNVLAYMDGSHLTRTYVETTAPVFERRLKDSLGW